MKINYFFKITFFLFFYSCTFSQNYKIENSNISYENNQRPSIVAKVDANADFMKKAFINYMAKNYQVKFKGYGFLENKDILLAKDVLINKISTKRLNLYSRITKTSSGSEIKLFGSFGYDIYLGTKNYENELETCKSILESFLNQALMSYYNKSVVSKTKEIKKLEQQKNKNDKSLAKIETDLNSIEEKITKFTDKKEYDSKNALKHDIEISKLNIKRLEAENKQRNLLLENQQINADIESYKATYLDYKSKQSSMLK